MIPRVDNQIDIDITEPGTWTGRCAEYCGLDHASMDFEVRAVDGDEFDDWLADQPVTEEAEPA
jgi:cytochrome c oxidase subunit 2